MRIAVPPGWFTDTGLYELLEYRTHVGILDKVIFNVVNGPNLLARGVIGSQQQIWAGRWTFESPKWRVTLDSRPNLNDYVKKLTNNCGHSFTHVGLLEHTDQSNFGIDDGASELENLFLFLTLVRGSTVGIALPTGFHQGRRVWTRWTSGLSSIYSGSFSWADPHRTEDISKLWLDYLNARADSNWSDALPYAIRYYAEALQTRSSEVTLTLAQAGLELLATAILVERDQTFSADKWNDEKAAWRLRKILQAASISLKIPNECKDLRKARKMHGWNDGVDATVNMRNTVTHWSTGKPKVDANAWIEVSQLSLQYLELCILWALGYSGSAFNRIEGPIQPGCSSKIPWHSSNRSQNIDGTVRSP
jgi:hypothetical protein